MSHSTLARTAPRGFRQCRRRAFATHAERSADFTHAVIGGGVVGLAIARKLAEKRGTSTLLIERNGGVGQETSSRNSEVIHAGLYYGPDSLKTKLCIEGRERMYALCKAHSIPHRNTKKWIVAQNDEEWEACLRLHEHAQSIGVPTRPINLEEGKRQEPDVRAERGILESESTGIVDSHSLMQYLLGEFESEGGDVALRSSVTSISQDPVHGYQITINDKASSTPISITAETVVNSAGLSAVAINNMLLPTNRQLTPYYCKGSYFAYSRSHPKPSTLVYPAPSPGHGGLGTHLTVDLAGQVRFGPDVEWVDDPNDLDPENAQLDKALGEIVRYLPGVDRKALRPDYAGMRPKLGKGAAAAQGAGFEDFVIRREEGYDGFVNLLGIESPGLTSSLAIAEMVNDLLYK